MWSFWYFVFRRLLVFSNGILRSFLNLNTILEHLTQTRKFLVISRVILAIIFLIGTLQALSFRLNSFEVLVNSFMLFYMILMIVLAYQEVCGKHQFVIVNRIIGGFSILMGGSLGYTIIKFGNNSFVWLGVLLSVWIIIVGLYDLFGEWFVLLCRIINVILIWTLNFITSASCWFSFRLSSLLRIILIIR